MNRAIGKTRGGMKIVRFSTGSENNGDGAAAEVERIVGVDIPSRDIGKCRICWFASCAASFSCKSS